MNFKKLMPYILTSFFVFSTHAMWHVTKVRHRHTNKFLFDDKGSAETAKKLARMSDSQRARQELFTQAVLTANLEQVRCLLAAYPDIDVKLLYFADIKDKSKFLPETKNSKTNYNIRMIAKIRKEHSSPK